MDAQASHVEQESNCPSQVSFHMQGPQTTLGGPNMHPRHLHAPSYPEHRPVYPRLSAKKNRAVLG